MSGRADASYAHADSVRARLTWQLILASVIVLMFVGLRPEGSQAPVTAAVLSTMCADGTTTVELCNVDEQLWDSFLLVGRLALAAERPSGERISAVVTEGRVSVEWYPNSVPLRLGVMGVYSSRERTIWLAPGLRDEPLRARASILGHELAHAAWDIHGMGSGQATVQDCMENEAQAYRWGIIIYEGAIRETREPAPPLGDSDAFLAEQLGRWRRASGGDQCQ